MKSITRFTKNIRGNQCMNCGTPISDEANFCSKCGQVNDTNRLSVKQYFSEYLSGFFNFDNRFIKTVIPLIFKPGYVTKEYIDGKRIKYVNPFQLYLHITILFFLLVGVFSTIDKYKSIDDPSRILIPGLNLDQGQVALDSLKSETLRNLQENDVELDSSALSLVDSGLDNISIKNDSIQRELEKKSTQRIAFLNTYIDSLVSTSGMIETFKYDRISVAEKDTLMKGVFELIEKRAELLSDDDKRINITGASDLQELWSEISKKGNLKKVGIKHLDSVFRTNNIDYEVPIGLVYVSKENQSGLNRILLFMDYQKDYPNSNVSESLKKLGFQASYWNVFLFSKSKEWSEAFGNEGYWEEIIDRVLSRISVALFFLLPIFTLIVSLLYIRRKYNYTENLVFVFHIQTVFFLLLLIFMIVNRIANSNIGIVIFLLTFMIYLYKAMKRFYGQGGFKTFIKYLILNSAFMVLAFIGGIIISFLAFLI